MTNAQDDRPTYQEALRVIGRHLDLEPAHHVTVLEIADGFTVRSHPSAQRADARTSHFTWDRLQDLIVFHAAGRGCLRRRHRHQGMWTDFPNGHEDFFRALGHTLDSGRATSLSVDEVDDGVAVSYVQMSEGGSEYEKVSIMMRKAEIEEIIRGAQERRVKQQAAANR